MTKSYEFTFGRGITAAMLAAALAVSGACGSGDSKPSALPEVSVMNDDPANMVRTSPTEPLCYGIAAEAVSPTELRVRPLLERPMADAGKIALLVNTNVGGQPSVPHTAQGDILVLPMPHPGERLGVTMNVEDFSGSPELPSLENLAQSPYPYAVPDVACASAVVVVQQR